MKTNQWNQTESFLFSWPRVIDEITAIVNFSRIRQKHHKINEGKFSHLTESR